MIRHSPRAGNPDSISWPAAMVVLAVATGLFAACSGGGDHSNPTASLSYESPQTYVVGTTIVSLKPTITGTLSGFTASPRLPAGLGLDANTGVISGTPTAVTAQGTYAVSAMAAGGGTSSATLTITVNAVPPSNISYGAAALTFTTDVAARMLQPTFVGGEVVSWSITPSLPAGLAFNTTNGSISGTPTATSAQTTYTVTAHNSGGQATTGVSLEVDSSTLIDFGHVNAISLLQFSGSRVLSEDVSGHWVLWDYAAAKSIQSGDSDCATAPSCVVAPYAGLAGATAVIETKGGFEVRSTSSGQLLSTIAPASVSWWQLASDGSYFSAGSPTGLFVWAPAGQLLFSRSGDYSKAIAFAAPAELRIADGPAGQNVVETVSVPSGTDSVGPAFQGLFSSWFLDGGRFLTVVGTTVAVYSSAAVRQDFQTLPTVAGLTGQGNWFWTYPNAPSNTLDVYAVGASSSPTATYNVFYGSVIPSALTIGIVESGPAQLSVVDLSGAAPAETTFAYPTGTSPETYAATSGTNWVAGSPNGVLFDGANLPTTRYFALGRPLSIAAGTSSIAVATVLGNIMTFDAVTLAPTTTIPFASLKLMLSSDGTVLAALGGALGGDCSVRVYSLPTASLLNSWSYTCTGGTVPRDIQLSGSGAVLGQVIDDTNSYTELVTPATGGSPIYSNTFASIWGLPTMRLSPDGAFIATSTMNTGSIVNPGTTPGTNILKNGTLVAAVTGLPGGWIDSSRLLVGNYQAAQTTNADLIYTGCSIYDPSGHTVGSCSLPELSEFQTITSDLLYSPERNSIFSVSAGTATWTSGNAWLGGLGAVAAGNVIFASGPRVLVQSY